MRVFLNNELAEDQPSHLVRVAPAADKPFVKGEVPTEWVDEENKPVQFDVVFQYGEANVSDILGKYLVDRGIAKKTRLIIPTARERRRLATAG